MNGIKMVDCNVNQPMISDKDKENTGIDLTLPIASISSTTVYPQMSVSQQSPRSPPSVLLDNFKNGNTK